MPRNSESRGAGRRTRLSEVVQAGSSNAFKNTQSPARPQAHSAARIIRLPIFRDGVFIGNEFIPISPRLRARIRQIAAEARR